ncbi:MAG: hypothetical protein H6741_04425 [Alphaproteobacteria bacterium]|nr:hypothetical protein [Alphaproteobacteria bacterium]MCB9791952.1 hypothetical protein [Alphaproteobacteria bacterium]
MSNHKNADAIGEILDRSVNLTDTKDALDHAIDNTYKAAVDLKDALASGQDLDPAALHQAYGALRAMLDHATDQASAIGASLAELSIKPGSGR